MEPVYTRIVSQPAEPTRQDIADLLATIGAPGVSRDVKRSTIQRLFDERGGGRNNDGHHVVDTLEDWTEF